jgi:ubiquinone/menaquinone biosynthesis C-methylase UbiE
MFRFSFKHALAFSVAFIVVMGGHSAIQRAAGDERDRDRWQQAEKVMDVIGVKPGMVIGEAGVGRGYFTFKLAKRVGDTGKVFANEISQNDLRYIRDRCQRDGIDNIETILGEVEDPLFPRGKLDMVFMVYVLHHLDEPIAFLRNIVPSLKPDATVVLLERDPDKWPPGNKGNHRSYDAGRHEFMPDHIVLERIEEAGYQLLKRDTFLERDNIYVIRPLGYN